MKDDKITKIGISSPEDVMYDSSYAEKFLEFLDWLKNDTEVKTISWFEYESL